LSSAEFLGEALKFPLQRFVRHPFDCNLITVYALPKATATEKSFFDFIGIIVTKNNFEYRMIFVGLEHKGATIEHAIMNILYCMGIVTSPLMNNVIATG
jgi:hypothetical protein